MVLLALLSALAVSGQMRMHLYPDDNLIYRDMVAHIDNGVVRMGPIGVVKLCIPYKPTTRGVKSKFSAAILLAVSTLLSPYVRASSISATVLFQTRFFTRSIRAKSSWATPISPSTLPIPSEKKLGISHRAMMPRCGDYTRMTVGHGTTGWPS